MPRPNTPARNSELVLLL
ncbi:hypothetical protein A2U01_0101004, partial [Trifolium medium]|nr:hypothetical protein [Trifolium medium]